MVESLDHNMLQRAHKKKMKNVFIHLIHMNYCSFSLVLLATTTLALSTQTESIPFDRWVELNQKSYSAEEYWYRQSIFNDNVRYIKDWNSKSSSFKLRTTKFADLRIDEYRQQILMNPRLRVENLTTTPVSSLSSFRSVNWEVDGYEPQVNNQGQCGDCWSFSISQMLAGVLAKQNSTLAPTLSAQQMVDCIPQPVCFGCGGCWPQDSLNYTLTNWGGLETWDDYPYTGVQGQCQYNARLTQRVAATNVVLVRGDQEQALRLLYANTPLSVCLDASSQNFMLYSHGLYNSTDCSAQDLDHAVLLYGTYQDTVSGRWAYLLQNSWGDAVNGSSGWGTNGLFEFDAQTEDGNLCGIVSNVVYLR